MGRYLVISYHTEENCKKAIGYFSEHHGGFIKHFDWGCADGDHNAYAIVEVESKDLALLTVPPLFRDNAKVVQLEAMTPERVREIVHS